MSDHRVAYWKQESRGRRLQLWEGLGGFGDRLFATVDKRPDGRWAARFGPERGRDFAARDEAVRAMSRRAADQYDVEVRTRAGTVWPRPGRDDPAPS